MSGKGEVVRLDLRVVTVMSSRVLFAHGRRSIQGQAVDLSGGKSSGQVPCRRRSRRGGSGTNRQACESDGVETEKVHAKAGGGLSTPVDPYLRIEAGRMLGQQDGAVAKSPEEAHERDQTAVYVQPMTL